MSGFQSGFDVLLQRTKNVTIPSVFLFALAPLMAERQKSMISQRKQPTQARSQDLIAAILEAAVRVLQVEGASRFTTARVAEKAGVSVGSLYQYFPNKASILFRLQYEEWLQTTEMLRALLEDASRPPLERLQSLVHTFICSECDEATIRVALSDAAPLYRNAPEAREARVSGDRMFEAFMREALPAAPQEARAVAGRLIKTTLSAAGKQFSEQPRSRGEITTYADAMSDMFIAYLERLATR